jgi:2-keto-4-pentenoate hydratase/2-oxohepta-3-ene-1,7-dioic acid hydratase in catechol pathway
MKIGRFESSDDSGFWGVLDEELASVARLDVPFASWAPRLALADEVPVELLGEQTPISELRLRAPLNPGARVFGVGLNYLDHIQDAIASGRLNMPEEPGAFIKPDSAIADPGSTIRFPSHTDKLDYEIELVLVIAQQLQRGADPFESLLGYTIGNDGSVRDVGRPVGGPDLYSMKGQAQMSPVGPWIATLGDCGGLKQPSLEMTNHINGELRQRGNTGDMHFPVAWILNWVNARNRLQPGDLVFTGTPAGTAAEGRFPFLRSGDTAELKIERIGELRFTVGVQGASDH